MSTPAPASVHDDPPHRAPTPRAQTPRRRLYAVAPAAPVGTTAAPATTTGATTPPARPEKERSRAGSGAAPSPDAPHPDFDEAVGLARGLARCVVETLAGARDIEQLTRWVTDDVYRHLRKRVVLAARARSSRPTPPSSPVFDLGNVHVTEPRPGAIEAVVIIRGRARTRAVALRLEHIDGRWRATAIHVL